MAPSAKCSEKQSYKHEQQSNRRNKPSLRHECDPIAAWPRVRGHSVIAERAVVCWSVSHIANWPVAWPYSKYWIRSGHFERILVLSHASTSAAFAVVHHSAGGIEVRRIAGPVELVRECNGDDAAESPGEEHSGEPAAYMSPFPVFAGYEE